MASRAAARRLKYDWIKADAWMKDNPTETFPAFRKAFPKYPFTDATYYCRRRKVTGSGRAYASSPRKTLYETIGTFEMKEVQKMSAVLAMKTILALMDKHGKTHVEIVRLAEPDSIEIRRFTR